MSEAFFPVAVPVAVSPVQTLSGADDDLAVLDQQIRIVGGTQRGSVPHQPHFGIDWHEILDLPASVAFPVLVRQLTEAIKRWVPRVHVTSIEPAVVEGAPERVTARVVWQPAVGAPRAVEVGG